MGLLTPLVNKAQSLNHRPEATPSDRLFTPANGMTAARPILAAEIGKKLIKGERFVTPWMIALSASDAEGNVARFIDKHWPESGLGSSNLGADADPVADTLAMLIVSGAALRAPRVSMAGKIAVAGILAQEGKKTQWAISSDREHRRLTTTDENPKGQKLNVPVENAGKEATLEKLIAITAAVATNDTDNSVLRAGLGVSALGFAAAGSIRGEHVRQRYEEQLDSLFARIAAGYSPEAQI